MIHWHPGRKPTGDEESTTPPAKKPPHRKSSGKPGSESYGFTGLEGDFEAERRRAAEAANEAAEPYEGEERGPNLPGTASGFTHP